MLALITSLFWKGASLDTGNYRPIAVTKSLHLQAAKQGGYLQVEVSLAGTGILKCK